MSKAQESTELTWIVYILKIMDCSTAITTSDINKGQMFQTNLKASQKIGCFTLRINLSTFLY